MSLPVLPKASFTHKNEWLKTPVKLYPFTCGQESILLQVKDSKDKHEKLNAIKQVLSECVDGINPGALPLFQVENLFLRLREKSAGETLQLTYVCANEVELPEGEDGEMVTRECRTPIHINLDLQKVVLKQEGVHNLTFQVSEGIGLKMRYPTLDSTLESDDSQDLVLSCIESVFDEENVYPAAEQTKEELERFYKSIPLSVKKRITTEFFQSMPSLQYTINAVCPKCGYKHTQEVDSLNGIFT